MQRGVEHQNDGSVQELELGLVKKYWLLLPSLRSVGELQICLDVKNIGSAFRP